MYAVVKTGGKQYKVAEGDVIDIEKVDGDVGDTVELDEVLLIGNADDVKIGQPLVPEAKVIGSVVRQEKAKKIIVFKAKRRKGYRKKQGHRQQHTKLKINQIIG